MHCAVICAHVLCYVKLLAESSREVKDVCILYSISKSNVAVLFFLFIFNQQAMHSFTCTEQVARNDNVQINCIHVHATCVHCRLSAEVMVMGPASIC